VTSLGALVADLTGGAERATVGSGAVTRDVTELAAGVALHSLSLAVAGEVVGATALVAGSGARVATEATAEASARATGATTSGTSGDTTSRAGGGTGSGTSSGRAGAVALGIVSHCRPLICEMEVLQQGGRAGRSCSSGRWRRSNGG
jgi:hypothetical protein